MDERPKTLAEQVIAHGPYLPGQVNPFSVVTSVQLNELREELIKLRQGDARATRR